MLALNRLRFNIPIVKQRVYLCKLKKPIGYSLQYSQYDCYARLFSSQAAASFVDLSSKLDKKTKHKVTKKTYTQNIAYPSSDINGVPAILSKPHLLPGIDANSITIYNKDDLILFTLSHVESDELENLTNIVSKIMNYEINQRNIYRSPLNSEDSHIYKGIADALIATTIGRQLFPLVIPSTNLIEMKERIYNILIECINKSSSFSDSDLKKKEKQADTIASNIISLIPMAISNKLLDSLTGYVKGDITKPLFCKQLSFIFDPPRGTFSCADTNKSFVVESILSFLDIHETFVEKKKVLKVAQQTKSLFASSMIKFVDGIQDSKVVLANEYDLIELISLNMNSNKMKSLIMDLQSIRKKSDTYRKGAAEKLLSQRQRLSPSISTRIHNMILNIIKHTEFISFPLHLTGTEGKINEEELQPAIAQMLLSIKNKQTKQIKANDDQEEETLGLAINTYVNQMDHQKMGSKLSKSICKDGKKSQLCYKYLLGLKTGSSTTQEFRENITNLYKNNLSKSNIYDEIVDYLDLNRYNDVILPLKEETSMFDHTMLLNELQQFIKPNVETNLGANFFSEERRTANITEFLDDYKAKNKKIGQHVLFTTITCTSIKDRTASHIRINDDTDDAMASLTSVESSSLKIPKVFIDNLPNSINEETLNNSFKRCGSVEKLWLFTAHDDDEEQNLKTKVINDEFPFKKTQVENGGVSSDADEGENDGKKLVKKKRYKKKVKRPQKTDSYAFVEMADGEGFLKATRDENRIFGLCINSNNCRIQHSAKMRTLYIEFGMIADMNDLKVILKQVLGRNFELHHENINGENKHTSSLFAHLEFVNHEEAWSAYQIIQETINKNREPMPMRVYWQKTRFYRLAKEKLYQLRDITF